MKLSDLIIITRGTKVILAITFSVSLAALVFAFFYYRTVNRSEDPRISKARRHLQAYEKHSGNTGFIEEFLHLDSALKIFRSLPDYENSFETGVVYNNKCSALLLSAIYDSTLTPEMKARELSLSLKFCDSSIMVYTSWLNETGLLDDAAIGEWVREKMKSDDPAFEGLNFDRIISGRIRNIKLAQVETPRRLSVSLTNKGAVYRHMMLPDSAMLYYGEALTLWPGNITAKSNLSVLTGGRPEELTFIEKLFPPDRKKKDEM